MDQLNIFTDTEPHKLARVSDPDTSKQAATKIGSAAIRQLVYDEVVKAGEHGITVRELCNKYPDMAIGGTLSSRPNELEKMGLIYYRGDTRSAFGSKRQSRIIRSV